jgi:hypothetical protein
MPGAESLFIEVQSIASHGFPAARRFLRENGANLVAAPSPIKRRSSISLALSHQRMAVQTAGQPALVKAVKPA